MKIKKILFCIAVFFALSLSVFAQDSPKIKVGIHFGSSAVDGSLSLGFENGFLVGFVSDDNTFMPFIPFECTSASVKASGNTVEIFDGSGNLLYSENSVLCISPLTSELDVADSIPYIKIGSIKYPEVLMFSADSGKITVINLVDAETYIKGVLPGEVYPSWHEEALKAAAVATRTYTYHSINGKHSNYGVDLCTTTCCQVYSGLSKRQKSTDNAVDGTKNLVLTYNGSLITAVYHAISGGITESAAGAWGGNPQSYPYLTVVETPFENYGEIARGHWTKVLYDEDLNALIASSSHNGKISAPIASITPDNSTPGYLSNVTITDIYGNSILLKTSGNVRAFFEVLSANFTIMKTYMPAPYAFDSAKVLTASGEVEFTSGSYAAILTADGKETVNGVRRAFYLDGKGHGHGVGLSQYGAQFAAKAGYSYSDILSTYYPGTVLTDFTAMAG